MSIQLVTLDDAAQRTGSIADKLKRLIDRGIIQGFQSPNGRVMLSEGELDKVISIENFKHLDGNPISISEAARRYDLHDRTIGRWAKAGHIRIMGHEKNKVLINEADIAYIKAVINLHGLKPGQALRYVLGSD